MNMLEPKELAERFGYKRTYDVNVKLRNRDMQRFINGRWVPTKRALRMRDGIVCFDGRKLRWNAEMLEGIL